MDLTRSCGLASVRLDSCLSRYPFSASRSNRPIFLILAIAAAISAGVTACAPSSSFVNDKSQLISSRRYSSSRNRIETRLIERTRTIFTASGVASFYTEGTRTASGERFDPEALTAAHPTLPFGTRLRVTDITTGRSVIVRVNDRGPHVSGRIVDVSYSAAQMLGIVRRGTANVKIQVVQ